jgi:hypothetical protein
MRQKYFVPESQIEATRKLWGDLPQAAMEDLMGLIKRFGISVSLGDV